MNIVKNGDIVATIVFRLRVSSKNNDSKIVVNDNVIVHKASEKTFFVDNIRVRQGALGTICNYTYGDYKCIVTHNDSDSIQSAIELAESEISKMLDDKTEKLALELAALQKAKDFIIPIVIKAWN